MLEIVFEDLFEEGPKGTGLQDKNKFAKNSYGFLSKIIFFNEESYFSMKDHNCSLKKTILLSKTKNMCMKNDSFSLICS